MKFLCPTARPSLHARCPQGTGHNRENLKDGRQGVNRPNTRCPTLASHRRVNARGSIRGTQTPLRNTSFIRNWKSKPPTGSGYRGMTLHGRGAHGLGARFRGGVLAATAGASRAQPCLRLVYRYRRRSTSTDQCPVSSVKCAATAAGRSRHLQANERE